jgi:hypothetical protein
LSNASVRPSPVVEHERLPIPLAWHVTFPRSANDLIAERLLVAPGTGRETPATAATPEVGEAVRLGGFFGGGESLLQRSDAARQPGRL